MDYSNYYSSILMEYFIDFAAVIIGIVMSILAGIYLIKAIVKENTEHSYNIILFIKNKKSRVDFICVILVTFIMLLILFWSRNVLADIPHAIKKDFTLSTGVVVGQDSAGLENVGESRGFQLKVLETGEILDLHVVYSPIRKGEVYEVIYLPHTKNGAILKRLDGHLFSFDNHTQLLFKTNPSESYIHYLSCKLLLRIKIHIAKKPVIFNSFSSIKEVFIFI